MKVFGIKIFNSNDLSDILEFIFQTYRIFISAAIAQLLFGTLAVVFLPESPDYTRFRVGLIAGASIGIIIGFIVHFVLSKEKVHKKWMYMMYIAPACLLPILTYPDYCISFITNMIK